MDELEPAVAPRIWPVLWREKYVILASVVVMLVLAFLYFTASAKVYQATADLQVSLTTANPGTTDVTAGNQALAQNYSTLLTSPGFLNQIRGRVDAGRLSTSELQNRLTSSVLPNSALIQVQATGPSPQAAETVAQQVVTGFIANVQSNASSRTNALQAQLQQKIASVNTQIDALRAHGGSAAEITSLTASQQALIQQNAALVANGLAQGTSVTESAPPVAASSPVSPKRSLDLVAGLLLGLLLGVVIAWLRQALRPAIHSTEVVRSLVDLPVLASIPLSRLGREDPLVAEAYRVLLANLTFSLRQNDGHVVAVLGINPQVGKTSTVEGVARAAADGDRRVLIVDGDMRAAGLSERYGCRQVPGLVDVLNGVISVDQAVREIAPNVWLLPTRAARTNAATLLSGNRMFAAFHAMRERFDVVLVDSPPLSGLADGLLIASQADTVLVVVRTGVTRPTDLTQGVETLENNKIPIAGMVVFDEVSVEPYYPMVETGSQESTTAAPS